MAVSSPAEFRNTLRPFFFTLTLVIFFFKTHGICFSIYRSSVNQSACLSVTTLCLLVPITSTTFLFIKTQCESRIWPSQSSHLALSISKKLLPLVSCSVCSLVHLTKMRVLYLPNFMPRFSAFLFSDFSLNFLSVQFFPLLTCRRRFQQRGNLGSFSYPFSSTPITSISGPGSISRFRSIFSSRTVPPVCEFKFVVGLSTSVMQVLFFSPQFPRHQRPRSRSADAKARFFFRLLIAFRVMSFESLVPH